ncbi:MAG: hypothetical protein J0M34_00020 [Alphaproteobacteria bacterium]|nr:hypothetical protein [Alphaproteobacteria bacterium]
MELDKQTRSKVWWGGAISSALKGIPQGLLLGAIGAGVLFGGIYLLGLSGISIFGFSGAGLAQAFGSFLYTVPAGGVATTTSMISPWPVIALNTVLTAVGNFLTGGDLAVAQYKQQVDHEHNNQRIRAIEGREQQMEQIVARHLNDANHHTHETPKTSQRVQNILEEGPRVKVDKPRDSHAEDAITSRLEAAERTIH